MHTLNILDEFLIIARSLIQLLSHIPTLPLQRRHPDLLLLERPGIVLQLPPGINHKLDQILLGETIQNRKLRVLPIGIGHDVLLAHESG